MQADEYPCPRCGKGCYSIRDNRDAPIPIVVPDSVHDDEGREAMFCPDCDEELTPEKLRAGVHDCNDCAVPVHTDGPLGHGWACGKCGAFLQAG